MEGGLLMTVAPTGKAVGRGTHTRQGFRKCPAILVRYDKKTGNYLALIKLACALLWYRRHVRLAVLR